MTTTRIVVRIPSFAMKTIREGLFDVLTSRPLSALESLAWHVRREANDVFKGKERSQRIKLANSMRSVAWKAYNDSRCLVQKPDHVKIGDDDQFVTVGYSDDVFGVIIKPRGAEGSVLEIAISENILTPDEWFSRLAAGEFGGSN